MALIPNNDFGARVQQRLHDEQVIWLTTVRSDGTPEPNPVSFLWDNGTFLIYGLRGSHKLDHIAHDSNVALTFNGDEQGGNVVVFTGTAQIDNAAPMPDQNPAYLTKYRATMQQMGMTPEGFTQSYGVPIRVTPTHLRGY
jgi:PPOX class probable F420-dependent enzyme